MPVDASLYSMIQPIQQNDAFQSMGKILQVQNQMDQRDANRRLMEKNRQVDEAFRKNVIVDDKGQQSINKQGVLADLYKVSGRLGLETERQFKKEAAEDQQLLMQEQEFKIKQGRRLAWGIHDQASYDFARQEAAKLGLPGVANMPPQYDKNYVNNMKMKTLEAEQQLAQMNANRSYNLQKDELGLRKKELDQKKKDANEKARMDMAKDANELGEEWRKNDVTKKSQEVATAYERIKASLKRGGPASHLALVFNFMKMLDPGSVVRESEFKNAEQARGAMSRLEKAGVAVPAFLKQGLQKIQGEGILLPEQVADFGEQSRLLMEAQLDRQSKVNDMYTSQAGLMGYDPRLVVNKDLFKYEPYKPQGMGGGPGGGNPDLPDLSQMSDDDVKKLYLQFGGK